MELQLARWHEFVSNPDYVKDVINKEYWDAYRKIPPDPKPNPKPDDEFPIYLIGILAGVALVVAIILVIICVKRCGGSETPLEDDAENLLQTNS